jgi:GntR family transcriptional regulator / MocR family aminotransferase
LGGGEPARGAAVTGRGAGGRTAELLLAVSRDAPGTLGSQIEDQLREGIRAGALRPGARVPSTRDLARQLGISRRVAVDAYAQLAAEGYLVLRQGARPQVSDAVSAATTTSPAHAPPRPRFDFLPSVPDVSAFPRAAWQRALREAVAAITDADLGYGDHRGVDELREALAEYLGRVRGVVASPANVLVTSGYTQGLQLVCRAIAARGGTRIAIEDPSNPDQALIALRAGLEPIAIPVDDHGIDTTALANSRADGVVLTPAHQHPTGVVLSPGRRAALVRWLRATDAIAIEDDYDAEYRYDRAAVGALQGLDPDRVVYAGSASKTLAPALRLGWLVVPPGLLASVTHEKTLSDRGTARVEQLAFARFLARGELDRHLRRMRARYTARRDALVTAVTEALPEAEILGIAAGLHATVRLPGAARDEAAIRAAAARRGIAFEVMGDYRPDHDGPATLLLGYAQMPEPSIRAGVRELAAAIEHARPLGSRA